MASQPDGGKRCMFALFVLSRGVISSPGMFTEHGPDLFLARGQEY